MLVKFYFFILQSPFNVITYSIIGDDRAPNLFNINPASGVISTSSQSLFSDPNTLYTVSISSPSIFALFLIIHVDHTSFHY